jgi:hypothetical protein
MRHAVETLILTIVTTAMVLYFVVFLLVTWSDRPRVGRYDNGAPRPVRPIQRKGTR